MIMREGQYQIPVTSMLHAGGPEKDVSNDDALPYRQQAELFASQDRETPDYGSQLREREIRIDWYRHEALHAPVEVKQHIGAKIVALITGERSTQLSMSDLLEKESLIGGQLFRVPSRFWVHPSTDAQSDTRDWYFNFYQAEAEHTIHYQTSSRGIFKLYNGKEYAFTDGELDRFIAATNAYEAIIARDVYGR